MRRLAKYRWLPTIAGIGLLAFGCSDTTRVVEPQSPSGPGTPTTPETPPQLPPSSTPGPTAFPPLARPGVAYDDPGSLYRRSATQHGSLVSRYVIYEDGTFELQFDSANVGLSVLTGRYTRMTSELHLVFDAWSLMGGWRATGVERGDFLDIRYNEEARWDDFVDGTYIRSGNAP